MIPIASEPLAEARSHPHNTSSSIDLLVDELIGVETKPSSETDPILEIFQELQTKIRDLEERDRKRDKEVKNLHHKLLGLKDENTELRRRLDGIESRQKTYNDENTELRRRLDGIESWQQTYSEEIAYDKRRISTLEKRPPTTNSKPTTIATKTEKRLERLDEWLFWRSTHTATYSEIGKYLELGTRDSKGKNTRRQHMYEFSKILKQFPDRYIIEETGHNNGKRVTLFSGWLRHLRIQNERKEVST